MVETAIRKVPLGEPLQMKRRLTTTDFISHIGVVMAVHNFRFKRSAGKTVKPEAVADMLAPIIGECLKLLFFH